MVVADKYRVLRELGRGGMGTVYEAVHTGIGKHVALKFLEGDIEHNGEAKARFLREAQTASLVESPHIVHIFDSGCSSDGTLFMVLELLRGEDLRSRLRREGRLSVEEAVSITEQTLRALVRTHAAGIVHRDLKPENIFLCDHENSTVFVKILDFGISKVTRPEAALDTLTHEGVVLGTAFYMSPEQARGENDLDGRSDLYGLGSIFFEMLAGRTPHVGNVYHAVLVDICTRDASDVRLWAPGVPEPIAQIIARALCRNRDARYPSAQAFLDALVAQSQGRVASGESLLISSTTVVSQLAPVALTAASKGNIVEQRKTVLGKLVVGILLSAILAAAGLMIVLHKRFKSQQAQIAAAMWSPSSSAEGGRFTAPATVKREAWKAVAAAGSAQLSPQPTVATNGMSTGPRHHSGDAGTVSRRGPPRSSTGNADELRLKTIMP